MGIGVVGVGLHSTAQIAQRIVWPAQLHEGCTQCAKQFGRGVNSQHLPTGCFHVLVNLERIRVVSGPLMPFCNFQGFGESNHTFLATQECRGNRLQTGISLRVPKIMGTGTSKTRSQSPLF